MSYVLGLIGAAVIIIVGIVFVLIGSIEYDIVLAVIIAILGLVGITLKKQ